MTLDDELMTEEQKKKIQEEFPSWKMPKKVTVVRTQEKLVEAKLSGEVLMQEVTNKINTSKNFRNVRG